MLDKIIIKKAKVHNLKSVDLEIPKNKLIVFTGVSGSGKSSLAFDTIYAEGQRRYVESLSSYARQFLGIMDKPDVEYIEGLSPAISIEQKSSSSNPRSTVGTVTEIYDYLRLLFARAGIPYDPETGKELTSRTVQEIVDSIIDINTYKDISVAKDSNQSYKILLLAPLVQAKKGTYEELFQRMLNKGFSRVRVNGTVRSLEEEIKLDRYKAHNIDLVVDRLTIAKIEDIESEEYLDLRKRVTDSVELALNLSEGLVTIAIKKDTVDEEYLDINLAESMVMSDGSTFPKLEPNLFSFNSHLGACPNCKGLGFLSEINPELVYNPKLTIAEGAIYPWSRSWDIAGGYYKIVIEEVAKKHKIDLRKAMGELTQKELDIILFGKGCEKETYQVNNLENGHSWNAKYEGVIPNLMRRYRETGSEGTRDYIQEYMSDKVCSECEGKRLNKYSLAVKIDGKNIYEVGQMNIEECFAWVEKLSE